MSTQPPEIIEGGICDGCGGTHEFLQVINCPPVAAGICLCRGCLERSADTPVRSDDLKP